MEWYQYPVTFFAGLFLANSIPHLVQGMSGNRFPTPFAKPPGKGLSSPLVNAVWALFNTLVGCLLLKFGKLSLNHLLGFSLFFAGTAVISILLSVHFEKKDKS